jgi:hypothetical protein
MNNFTIVSVPVEIRTEHLQNKSHKFYRLSKLAWRTPRSRLLVEKLTDTQLVKKPPLNPILIQLNPVHQIAFFFVLPIKVNSHSLRVQNDFIVLTVQAQKG